MPAGVYTVMDGKGNPVGTEEFRCAPGPAGWRYFATIETSVPEPHREIVDFVVDGWWLPVRLRIDSGSHDVDLTAEENRLAGTRDGEPLDIEWDTRLDLDYFSPCFNAVTANRLGRTDEIRVVYLDPELDTPVGRFSTSRWQYTGLDTGWTGSLWVAGEIVVSSQNVFELAAYDPGPRGPFPLR